MEATMTLLIRRISKFQPEEASKNLQWWEDQLPQSLPSAIENKLSQKESSFPSSRCELLVSGRVTLRPPRFSKFPPPKGFLDRFPTIIFAGATVDGRNPQQPPDMYETLWIIGGYLPYRLVCRIFSINTMLNFRDPYDQIPHYFHVHFDGFGPFGPVDFGDEFP